MSTLDISAEILREVAPRALCAKEIAEIAGARLPTASKTPQTVVSRDLAIDVRDRGADSRFLRVDRGEFVLKGALPTALYNDNDAYAAQWTRNLAEAGEIAPGVVDERSIRDLKPADVACYRQFHAFSGVGTWSRALRDAGWDDSVPVWTGSCPCQPFSQAGRKAGFDDEQHLWPEWFRLIEACRPPVIFAEQVASKDGLAWLNVVQSDLEGKGYTVRAIDLCAAGFGAPHLRQRLYLVAVAGERGWEVVRSARLHDRGQSRNDAARRGEAHDHDAGVVSDAAVGGCFEGSIARRVTPREDRSRLTDSSGTDGVVDAGQERREGGAPLDDEARDGWSAVGGGGDGGAVELGDAGLARGGRDAGAFPGEEGAGAGERIEPGDLADEPLAPGAADGSPLVRGAAGAAAHGFQPGDRICRTDDPTWGGSVGGFWARDVEWIYCRPAPGHQDGCFRPAESFTQPLVTGSTPDLGRTRAKRLRGFGNGIVLPQAVEFIGVVIDALTEGVE